ncbi:signal recognition particle 54 kDa protein SRP54, putative (macronuclear) [Tetrahymena thermophila SB210]|uniref:signal-recognition-particle GTPase n=1 Tax=Tetrahymena thermophila (strain SB210) TaxID=312017 RepID=I7LU88_TETTS|nr:signal recognition particle 54 kDa protein SRP54, putative [Tetrahymena thermophila SB210]EAR90817.1 signal recognition particle 54 kDa protein SRP54, putative [Tetrahymena thermophila SB210]|eukprot:XP_001011062.1 signal recognition particle 54 kDa protein SRP54, putative [Tetrahymena thermophila SB210]
MVLNDLGKKINDALSNLNKDYHFDKQLLNKVLKDIQLALLQSDINVKYVKQLSDNILQKCNNIEEAVNKKKLIQQLVVQELTKMLDPKKQPFSLKSGKPNVVMFVGLQGAGKTTTCAKYANYWKKKGWRTCLICADTFRAGAFDQLQQIATKIRIPFYGNRTETDPVAIAIEGVKTFQKQNFEVIIIDTSGRHMQESELFDEMKQIYSAVCPNECIFVMDGSNGQACLNQAQAFKKAVDVGSVIITKLDGHSKGGGALSAVAATESPIIFLGTGEHFDDLETFKAESFVKRLLGLGDFKGMIETVSEVIDLESQQQNIKQIAKGQFTLRALQQNYKSILKMGSLNQFMSMIPGMQNIIQGQISEKEQINKIKKSLTIMDSMSNDELDGITQITQKQLFRISKGSGQPIENVKLLIDEQKTFAKTLKKIMPSMKDSDSKTKRNAKKVDGINDLLQNLFKKQ